MVEPWAHQRAVQTDLVLGHWLLLWEMGTGKTGAMLAASDVVGGRMLWLTLAVLVPQALAEIRRWRPAATVQVMRNGRERVSSTADVIVCSYDLMRRLPVWRQLYGQQWDCCVCDEGHALGHGASLRAQAFYGSRDNSQGALFRKCDRVWVATGTPVLSSPDELHPHLSRLFPQLIPDLRRKQDFLARYCILVRRTFGDVVVGGRNLAELRDILRSCASRLALTDVVDLPPLLVDTIPVEVTKAQREAIEASITPDQARELHVVLTQLRGGVEAAWQRLQAMLLPLASLRRVIALAKAQAAAEIVKSELAGGADRIVLFGLHLDALNHVASECKHFAPRLLIGATTQAARDAALRAFDTGSCRLLIASIRLAGFGLNLQAARRCVFLETAWTPAEVDQCVARLYRAGQTRPVHASILAISNSIDARVAEVIRRKRTVVHELLGGLT